MIKVPTDNPLEKLMDMRNLSILLLGLSLFITQFTRAQNDIGQCINGSFIDSRDGKTYKTINIGNQTWMAENLNYNMSDSWYNQCETYGRLYTFNAALNACPSGWHLPGYAEWTNLTAYLGGDNVAGGKLKETGTTHWQSPNAGATNETGFAALPGSYRYYYDSFGYVGYIDIWWSSPENDTNSTWNRDMGCSYSKVYRSYSDKEFGFSVRCMRDEN